jgi:hypothetical protein
MPEKLKCNHQGCGRPVMARCLECSAPYCEFHSVGGRFCSKSCHEYGKRKLDQKKAVTARGEKIKKLKETAAKAVAVLTVLTVAAVLGPNFLISLTPEHMEQWNSTTLEGVLPSLAGTDMGLVHLCNGDGEALSLNGFVRGDVVFMPNNGTILFVVGIPPYNMRQFDGNDLCMEIKTEGGDDAFSQVMVRGNVAKLKPSPELLRALDQGTKLTETELGFISKASASSDTGVYELFPKNITAKVNN